MPFFDRKAWKRTILAVGTIGGLAIVVIWALYVYFSPISERSFQKAVAEADRLDPGWRLEELQAKRDEIPDAENAALCVEAAFTLLPTNWPSWQLARKADEEDEENVSLEDSISALSPEMQLNQEQLEYLRSELQKAAAALAKAQELSHLLRGRHEMDWSRQHSREIAGLLRFNAILLAQENKGDRALENTRGVLNSGRSIGDAPQMTLQMLRMSVDGSAVRCSERILAQAQPSEEALKAAQELMEDEAAQPLGLILIRAERAESSQNLRLATKYVEIAKLPPEEQLPRLKQLKETETNLPRLALVFERSVQRSVISQAYLRCAYVFLAVERYRLAHGRWPDSLTEAVPEFLRQLPCDPYNGQPLHYRRTKDGVLIYSVGPDGNDDGGKIDRKNPTAPGTDLGFQLWDVSHRRQPWRPRKPAGKEDK